MKVDDPFASITKHCAVSSSQEDHLCHCRFVGESEVEKENQDSEDSRGTPMECTGIMMMSLSESSEDNDQNDNNSSRDNDVFHTPPEDSLIASSQGNRNERTFVVEEKTEGDCTEGEKTVELWADTDLTFSEVELRQRFDGANEVIHCKLNRANVTNECVRGSLSKKRKFLDENLGSESPNQFLDAELEGNRENIMKSLEKLNSNRVSPYSRSSKSPNQISEVTEGSSARRKLHFSTEVLELETEVSGRDLGLSEGLENNIRNGEGNSNLREKNIDDIDKYRYVGPTTYSYEKERRNQGTRALPVSICGHAGKESNSGKNHGEITLLDVLRMLAANCSCDRSLENKSILDVAKSRGMTFP